MARHRHEAPAARRFLEADPASLDPAATCTVQAVPPATGPADATHHAPRPDARHRARERAAVLASTSHSRQPPRGAHRRLGPRSPHRVRTVSAALAAGAVLAGGSWTAVTPAAATASAQTVDGAARQGPAQVGPSVLAVSRDVGAAALAQLSKGTRLASERAARAAEARRPLTVSPTTGTITSGFGARWGTNHDGVDIANSIGTPVLAVTDGVVLQSGPASGFGLWVRVRQDDGTIGIYGHINESFVAAGQEVSAGQEIATVGNRGVSTGPHLHYGVQTTSGAALDPLPWLGDRGVSIS
jgi:murein DD-endopeptidase MepM/ murein hydrolase activator NlpD